MNLPNEPTLLQVELVDMHFGSGPTEEGAEDACEDCDPFLLEDHLIELRECHKFSKSVFFIVSTVFKHPYSNSSYAVGANRK